MFSTQNFNYVIVAFLSSSDQIHGIVGFPNFIGVKYLINEDKDYYLNNNNLKDYVLRYINEIQVEEHIYLSGYALQHKSILGINLSNKSIFSKDLEEEIQKKYREYCKNNKLNLATSLPLIINRIAFSKKLKKFIETADDNTSEKTEYYIFIKKESNSEIEESLCFTEYNLFQEWVYKNDLVWLD